ncbi:MAG: hypothetical protein JWO42_240, partial [Chloroflexi bacterium]|nr:hypothetical protein [Chloroflexota bacterium]
GPNFQPGMHDELRREGASAAFAVLARISAPPEARPQIAALRLETVEQCQLA